MREVFWIGMVMVVLIVAGASSDPQSEMLEAELTLPQFLQPAPPPPVIAN